MKYIEKNTVYAVKRGEAYIGLFSSPESAMKCECDTLEEIRPALIEGSPDSGRYVCVAKGVVSTLFRDGDSFRTEYTDLGPVWGVNIQSAIAQLLGCGSRRRNLEITKLRIYEIDKDYSEGIPENLARVYDFVVDELSQDDALTNDVLGRNYIASYFEGKRREAEIEEIYHSEHMEALINGIMRGSGSQGKIRCGFAYRRQLERIRRKLSRHFLLKELQFLSVLFELETDAAISGHITSETISKPEIAELLERFQKCLPRKRYIKGGI